MNPKENKWKEYLNGTIITNKANRIIQTLIVYHFLKLVQFEFIMSSILHIMNLEHIIVLFFSVPSGSDSQPVELTQPK